MPTEASHFEVLDLFYVLARNISNTPGEKLVVCVLVCQMILLHSRIKKGRDPGKEVSLY
jgi:hypothetical protein